MDKIKLGLFETFSYLLPGLILLTGVANLFTSGCDIVSKFYQPEVSLSTFRITVVLVIAYVVGFSFHYVGYHVFAFLGPRLYPGRFQGSKPKLSSKKLELVTIRDKSPANYSALEKWMAYRGMCYNTFFALSIFVITIIISLVTNEGGTCGNALLIGFFALIVAVLCLRRAATFHEWAINTIDSTMEFLNGEEPTS